MISATDEVLHPTNTIAVAGHKMTLPCSSRFDNESRWDFYPRNSVSPFSVYNGDRLGDNIGRRVGVDFDSCSLKTCNLTIESVQLRDSGYYICFEASRGVRIAASLIVLSRLLL